MTYNEGLASLAFRAKWACVFLWLFIAVSALGIPVGLSAQYVLELEISPAVLGLIILAYGLLSLVAWLGAILTVPTWTYRAWTNLRVLGLSGLRFRPAWAALSYFVPLAGFVVPFFAMRELYNRSTGEDEDRRHASVADVTSWWASYIAGLLVSAFIVITALFNLNGAVFIVTSPVMELALAIFANILTMGAAWFLIRIIRMITVAQSSSAGVSETFA